MVRIKMIKMKPRKTCHPNYRLSLRGTKVGLSCFLKPQWWSVVCWLTYLTNIWLMFCSLGKQTEGKAHLYRAGCLLLTVISLVLLLIVIILGLKREYLQPCQWLKKQCTAGLVHNHKGLHFLMAVQNPENMENTVDISVRNMLLLLYFSHNNRRYRNTKCGWLNCSGLEGIILFPHNSSHCALISSPNWIHGLPSERGNSSNKQSSNLQLRAMPNLVPQCFNPS